jgi:hypothetical protein
VSALIDVAAVVWVGSAVVVTSLLAAAAPLRRKGRGGRDR